MAKIEKKIWPEFFEAMVQGREKLQLRLNDFDVNEGDILVFKEYDPKRQEYTGRSVEKKVASVLKFHPDKLPYYSKEEVQQKGLQVISFE